MANRRDSQMTPAAPINPTTMLTRSGAFSRARICPVSPACANGAMKQ
jgi:hypothetical protein